MPDWWSDRCVQEAPELSALPTTRGQGKASIGSEPETGTRDNVVILEALGVSEAKLRDGLQPPFHLTLYISGGSARSELAVANLRRICDQELPGQYELEVIDVLEQPERAEDAKILATPTLIKELPPPLRRIIGDLSDKDKLLFGLALERSTSPSSELPDVQ